MNFAQWFYNLKPVIYYVICLIVSGCLIQGIFIAVEHKEKFILADVLKGCASVIFCIIGILGYMSLFKRYTVLTDGSDFKAAKLIVCGLIFGAVGDILLNLRFVFEKNGKKIFLAGIAAFLTGHILYLVSIIPFSKSLIVSCICGVAAAAIILVIVLSKFKVSLAFKIFGIIYVGSVVLMTSIAVGNCITSDFSCGYLVFALGAILFTLSDVILIFNTFGDKTLFPLRILNLSLYYLGQILIAFSLFLLWY
ncbi:MAG: lysoplasmalogenase [Treponema sp.]|nr:lysoplasmalogenase [Treponema sp.]